MAETRRKVSDLQHSLPRYFMLKDRISGSAEQANRLIGRLKKHYQAKGRIDLTDGLKVDFPDHWIHVRPSNTEPIIRVLAEAKTRAKAAAALDALKDAIAAALKSA
jgi:phosphomannomutase